MNSAKWAVYLFALILSAPIPVLCFERDSNGNWAPNDNPPLALIFGLSTFAACALGVQIPRDAIASILHLPQSPPDENP
ncbi:hypothetical protein [Leptolyngbya sp. FACHB-16]|uniref:hypothetical protein n=1 Tax=unclassified Leptolyngbya TaxID=2650499 RepID=UPI0016871132|nr:hypothetical protein [Leptolyngbya sp. FACHB-16]MBD2156249.1 hypothetical protein [Leptolyngbya sp. FACHB-16]